MNKKCEEIIEISRKKFNNIKAKLKRGECLNDQELKFLSGYYKLIKILRKH